MHLCHIGLLSDFVTNLENIITQKFVTMQIQHIVVHMWSAEHWVHQ
jgi:hypothetical protein